MMMTVMTAQRSRGPARGTDGHASNGGRLVIVRSLTDRGIMRRYKIELDGPVA